MDLEEFRTNLIQEVNVSAATNEEDNGSEFIKMVVQDLIEFEECTDFLPLHFEGRSDNNRVAEVWGYNFDEDDNTLSLFICDYSGSPILTTITKTDVEKLANRARAFAEGSLSGIIRKNTDESSEEIIDLANLISQSREVIERYRLYVITDKNKSERIKTVTVPPINGRMTVISLWDISNYYDLAVSKSGYDETIINIKDFGFDGIPCLKVNQIGTESNYDSYLSVMPGILLMRLFEHYGGRLLEANVRSFLKITTKTNKAIKATILKEPSMFFAYNNGITVTATDLGVSDTPTGKMITRLTSMQIVNGGQTTATIYTVAKSKEKPDIDSIYVPMKISVVSPDGAEEIIPKISRSANTQNKVSEADFFSNHPFHRSIERFSRTIMVSPKMGETYGTYWFYERARGQYQQEIMRSTSSQKDKFKREYPKTQYFTKTDLAKYRNSYEGKPHIVSRGAQENFLNFATSISNSWGDDGSNYNEFYFKTSVALAILFKETEKIVSAQPWYANSYRANIVTYSIAFLAYKISNMGGTLDLMNIWNNQSIPDIIKNELIKITKLVYESIISENIVVQNVTQWCKREACWLRVKQIDYELNPEIYRCLISEKKEKYMQRTAKTTHHNTNIMNANIEVVRLGSEYWKEVLQWGIDNNSLSREERSVIGVACNLEYRRPSEKQSAWIVKIRERLRAEGFTK